MSILKKVKSKKLKRITLAIILLIVMMYTNGQVQPRLVLPVGHTRKINCIDISNNNKFLATSSDDKTVIIWDLNTGEEKVKLRGHTKEVNSVNFSFDEKFMVMKY